MIEMSGNELVFVFPEVSAWAELRVHFRLAHASQEPVHILERPTDNDFLLSAHGPLVMHMRPKVKFEEVWYGRTIRYPFAVLLTVDGLNALTGEPSSSLVRSPQNYFVTPPQGGIDGYFAGGKVWPFRSGATSPLGKLRLEIKVFPVKGETWEHWMHCTRMAGWSHAVISGLTLAHGGDRECEPIYEDPCCIGDWDQRRGAEATVWLTAGS